MNDTRLPAEAGIVCPLANSDKNRTIFARYIQKIAGNWQLLTNIVKYKGNPPVTTVNKPSKKARE